MKLIHSTALRRALIAGLFGGLCFALLATWPAAGIALGPLCALALLLGAQRSPRWRSTAVATAALLGVAAWQTHAAPEQGPASLVAGLMLIVMLALPLLQAWVEPQQTPTQPATERALGHAWHVLFTVLMTLLLLVACWLLLGLWAQMFSLLHIDWFEWLFFNTAWFAPIACGLIIGSSIALCHNAPQASGWLRNLLSQFARGLAPLQGLALLAFALASLGLRPLPDWAPGALPLAALALTMLLLDAMAQSREQRPLPAAIRALTAAALALTPLLALLAAFAIATRVGQYGWTPKRVLAAVAAAYAFSWGLGWLVALIMRWRGRPLAPALPGVAALGLGALLVIALQSPLLDPQRLSVNSQMARLENGIARADDSVLQLFEDAGALGKAALAELGEHPQWLENPDRQRLQLAQRQGTGSDDPAARPSPELLKRYLHIREDSAPPPDSWWQGIGDDAAYTIADCLVAEGQCTVWSMPMTDDDETAVLVYDPKTAELDLFAQQEGRWAPVGTARMNQEGNDVAERLLKGQLGTRPKRWRDLTVDGQRYPVDYYNNR